MTTKELQYVEDALSHASYFQTACADAAAKIKDTELKTCIEQIGNKHRQIFGSFYELLG